MNLIRYWPTPEEVDQCIKPEAEGAHDAVLLAVHQPSPLSYRIGDAAKVATTEDELYRYFTTPDVPMGAHVLPITGASGVGKSHLVRLLAARLKSDDSARRFVVIRIPKSASLRRVVELILDPLPDEGYAHVKQAFKTAMADVDIDTAAISFQANLEIALRDLAADLRQQVVANPANQLVKQKLGHALALPKLMADPTVVEHFRRQVFPKIVKRVIGGHHEEDGMARVEDFTAADFELPDTIELGNAASSTQIYYQTVLRKDGGAGMGMAADLLNGRVVDQAMRQLFQLHEALGGMSLQDVIIEIRKLLLRDGRELVILVEDFKALTGIQDTLLHVLIQEGVRDGKRELATMRSAIAVTDGYLAGQDTIATRAKREWIVESQLASEEEVLDRTKRLVASYLNAARWGHEKLERHYAKQGKNWSGDEAWIEPFVDADAAGSDQLEAFGAVDGIPLFPFNDLAIERLARMALTQGHALVFTPRFVIDHVLRNVLLAGRPAYDSGLFPPAGLVAPAPSADVAQWLAGLSVSGEQRRRYEKLITIWGDGPVTRADVGRIPPLVFKAFGLEPPAIAPLPRIEPEKGKTEGTPPPPPPPPPPETSHVADLRAALENWVQKDVRLEQALANQIRMYLEQAISERIDWNAERCIKLAIGSDRISIPLAGGEAGIRGDAIRLASDHCDPDGQLRTDLVALLRFYQFNKRKTDYDEVDDDLARIGNLVNRLMPQALAIVRGQVKIQLQNASKLLATNSRVLGLLMHGRTPATLSAFLFPQPQLGDPPPASADPSISEWRALQESAQSIRGNLRDMLLERCGCFQGTGSLANGVDIVRVVEYFPADEDKLDIEVLEVNAALRSALPNMREAAVNARAKRVLAEALRLQQVVQSELGESFDKKAVADALKELAEGMKKLAIWQQDELGMTPEGFMRLCANFSASALKEALVTLQASAQFDEQKNEGKALSRIAQIDVNPLIVAANFVKTASKVAAAAKRRADMLEGQTMGLDIGAQADEIRATFDHLVGDMDALEVQEDTECS
jgi:hypothetical protein